MAENPVHLVACRTPDIHPVVREVYSALGYSGGFLAYYSWMELESAGVGERWENEQIVLITQCPSWCWCFLSGDKVDTPFIRGCYWPFKTVFWFTVVQFLGKLSRKQASSQIQSG